MTTPELQIHRDAIAFRETGEVRAPKKGEWFLNTDGACCIAPCYYYSSYPILDTLPADTIAISGLGTRKAVLLVETDDLRETTHCTMRDGRICSRSGYNNNYLLESEWRPFYRAIEIPPAAKPEPPSVEEAARALLNIYDSATGRCELKKGMEAMAALQAALEAADKQKGEQ